MLFFLSSVSVFAQFNPQKPDLCQGHYFTEKQAKKFHKQLSKNYHNQAEWEARANHIREGILEGLEIKNLAKSQLIRSIIREEKKFDGYTVQNVAIETLEGFYVCGNLYRPIHKRVNLAGILCPQGHSKTQDSRLLEYTQQRCASLARMGAVVFAYDMIGYGETNQCNHKIEKAAKLQAINSTRALDFLLQQVGVDKNRIGMTGESGGGTQTFILTAIDDRIRVSVPVVQVSAHFFGGCVCESGMPIHKRSTHQTTNVEIAALAAPRPMLMISDGDDWTKNTEKVEFPHIQRIYSFFEKVNFVENKHFPNEKHDYGFNKRQAAYQFLAKHLNLDIQSVIKDGVVDESKNTILKKEVLEVFNQKNPRPANAVMGDEAVLKLLN